METTLIQLKKETADLLKGLKKYNRQSYDDVIKELIHSVDTEALTQKEKKDIEEALNDVRKGKVYRIEDVAREFSIKLKN